MPISCSVAACSWDYQKAKKEGQAIRFFSFPTDKELRKEWITRCYANYEIRKYGRICSNHFIEDDFMDYIQAKLMGYAPRQLKKNAIPSVNLLEPLMPLTEIKCEYESMEGSDNEYEDEVESLKKKIEKLEKRNKLTVTIWKEKAEDLQKKYNDGVESWKEKQSNDEVESWKNKTVTDCKKSCKEQMESLDKKCMYINNIWVERNRALEEKYKDEIKSWKEKKENVEKKFEDINKIWVGRVKAAEEKYKDEIKSLKEKKEGVDTLYREVVESWKEKNEALQKKYKDGLKSWKAKMCNSRLVYKERVKLEKAYVKALQTKYNIDVKFWKKKTDGLVKANDYGVESWRIITEKIKDEVKLWKAKTEDLEKKYNYEVKLRKEINESVEKKYKNEIESLKAKIKALQEKCTGAYEDLDKLREKNMKAIHQKSKDDVAVFDEKVKAAFSHLFSPSQIDIILKRRTRKRWTEDELYKAFKLRCFGNKIYTYVRDIYQYPLPGETTLKKWADDLNLKVGICNDDLNKIKMLGSSKTEMEKVTILLFDEMKISGGDYKDDTIVGPHASMLVIMACGLFDNWKQPIYVTFDEHVTNELLTTVINSLHDINFPVVACVSDCGAENQRLWHELHITFEKPYIVHPKTDNKIFFFADIPHVMVLIRNWLYDTGFKLKDGKFVKIDPVEELLKITKPEISSSHKLLPSHINSERKKRRNIKQVAELMSSTTSQVLIKYLPGNDPELAMTTGEFIGLTNKWFDIGNSNSLVDEDPLKRAYGLHLEDQNCVLDKMISTINEMRCIGKQCLQVFQKGVMISSSSLQGLYNDMNNKYNAEYIFTQRLNQDCLKNLFSQIILEGAHKSPMIAMYRLRSILVGKNSEVTDVQTNLREAASQETYVVSSAIPKARISILNMDETIDTEIREFSEISATDMETEEDNNDFGSTSTSLCSTMDVEGEDIEQEELNYVIGY